MLWSCETTAVERAQAWLGTRVVIRADAWDDGVPVHEAIDAAFREVACVHRLMSFHAPDSDVSRLNRDAYVRSVAVDERTREVIGKALALSRQSDGVFDIALGGDWVSQGLLPCPTGSRQPDPMASFADIEIDHTGIRFHRPLWIDLGGIAKGYAADCAVAVLRKYGVRRACVDAGGDLATLGAGPHRIALDDGAEQRTELAVIEIGEGAVATSCNTFAVLQRNEAAGTSQWDARRRHPIEQAGAATVVAERAIDADALTKIVMALRHGSGPILRRFHAHAYLHDEAHGWSAVNP